MPKHDATTHGLATLLLATITIAYFLGTRLITGTWPIA